MGALQGTWASRGRTQRGPAGVWGGASGRVWEAALEPGQSPAQPQG